MSIYENYIASHLFPCDASKSAVCLFPMHAYIHFTLLCIEIYAKLSKQHSSIFRPDKYTKSIIDIFKVSL